MKTRNKILAWAGMVCLVAFAVYAASPSFSDFLTTQFATSNNKVAIKVGALTTNFNVRGTGAAVPLQVDDLSNFGQVASFNDHNGSSVLVVNATAINASQTYNQLAGNVNITALTASTVVTTDGAKNLASLANAAGVLLNDGSGGLSWVSSPASILDWTTNALQSASAFPVAAGGQYTFTNGSAGITFTGVSGSDSSHDRWGVLIIDAGGADRTLTLPTNWRVPDGNRTITVTNGVVGVLSVNCYANKYTNATYRAYF